MWGWEGLYGRPGVGGGHVPPRCEPEEQDAGDHKGPPNPSSSALAPTDRPPSCLTSQLRLMLKHPDYLPSYC